MRILKEYSALRREGPLDGLELELIDENEERAVRYMEDVLKKTNVDYKTKQTLINVTGDVFHTLARNAGIRETVKVACSYHKYYYMLAFEFAESALPFQTLNKSVKVLSVGRKTEEDVGFTNVVLLTDRIDLTVDKVSETMRLSIIKEKKYPLPNNVDKLPPIHGTPPFQTTGTPFQNGDADREVAYDFSVRLYQKFGLSIDKFLIAPQMFLDNLEVGELSAGFLEDGNGNCAGGLVWQKTYGIVVLMVITTFTDSSEAKTRLIQMFNKAMEETDARFVVSKMEHSELIEEYFDHHDEKYRYKSLGRDKVLTSYVKPDLIPLIKKAYHEFDMDREIHEIKHDYRFYEPYSVLTAKIDTVSSEAVLSILWAGDDLKDNVIRHIIALKRIGIENIFFRLDLGVPDEAIVSDLIASCGFEAEYLWPYSGQKGDVVIFSYYESVAYEIKPCEIAPVDKENIYKIPKLVRSVYGDYYSSNYLYHPERMWEKIRKRHLYSYIAIDDDKKAVGMIAFVKMSGNPYLFEIGKLMVAPEQRGTNVASQLIDYVYHTAMKQLDFDAVFSESVTNHKFSQRSCINSGFQDTGLKLNVMSEDAFQLQSSLRRIGRVSCVVSCIERANEEFSVYMPKRYEEWIRLCFEGLKPRIYKYSKEEAPKDDGVTEYQVGKDELLTSKLIEVTIYHVGSDIESVVRKLERYAKNKEAKCVLVNIPLNDVHNAVAVDAFRENGFFFGGVVPYWLPESDALFMQKLYGNAPNWDKIKLYSRKIKEMAKRIRMEIEELNESETVNQGEGNDGGSKESPTAF